MTQQTLGVLDHFAIGEKSVEERIKVLQAGNRLEGRHDAAPKIGKDGKGQFNHVRPRWDSHGVDELPRDGEALLLAVYRG